ncbi:hypothetical protein [Pseudonocardia sp.]|uniref:rolling circle replication-associated protein n=1 Tax=Pseudonocardia sp. TaxID=60912 RepID=UPI00261C9211|nr:hypothetical protein [Pseudonocardia sp.]
MAAAADLLPSITEQSGRDAVIGEGPRWEIVVSPGVIRVRTRDYARAERTHERQLRHHQAGVDIRAGYLAEGRDVPEPLPTRGTICAWSAKSRARLIARLSDLDYTRLYGRYRTCTDCGTEHSDQLDHCPACRSPRAAIVDRTGRLPAMLTLTYPGDWLTVAPDAETVKRHFWALCKRYERTWGEPLIGPWKLEFQRRGAPHFHISTTPPMGFTSVYDPDAGRIRSVDFRTWLSLTWAEIVAHPDAEQRRRHRLAGTGVDYAEGIKLTDPRRMAVYFAKYGTSGGKEYQHRVPAEWCSAVLVCDDCGVEYDADSDECPDCGGLDAELVDHTSGPGRFWGYRGLRPVLAVRQVTPAIGIQAGRVLRRWYRSKRLTRQITVERVEQSTGRVYTRRTRVRKRLFAHNRGFACVNDGPAYASQLARYLVDLTTSSSLHHVPELALPRGAGNARSGAGAGASVERPTGRTTDAPAPAPDSPSGAP